MSPEPLALYIHWPFCLAKCPYCDFNSHVRDSIPQDLFATVLRRELAHEAARLNQEGTRRLGSIFFGGGTPSLMASDTVASLIEDAHHLFTTTDNLEITLEANPTSVEAEKFAAFHRAGVNRLSLGVQSLRDHDLTFLGRHHSSIQARAALELARDIFPRLSFDLIYARPGQTCETWRQELRQALAIGADHLSLYQLTIEPGTRFATLHHHGKLHLPNDDLAADLYIMTGEETARYGLQGYEVSNYARPGHESRHNLAYWRYGDYLGIGPGAHSRLTLGQQHYAAHRHRSPEIWTQHVIHKGTGMQEEIALSPEECGREALLMGLRLREGVDTAHFARRTGRSLESCLDMNLLSACQDEGYLIYNGHTLKATDEGRLRLESLLRRLVL